MSTITQAISSLLFLSSQWNIQKYPLMNAEIVIYIRKIICIVYKMETLPNLSLNTIPIKVPADVIVILTTWSQNLYRNAKDPE